MDAKVEKKIEKNEVKKIYTQREHGIYILDGEINHWKYLERGLGIDSDIVRKRIGALVHLKDLVKNFVPNEVVKQNVVSEQKKEGEDHGKSK